jgi:hypothetical protein
VDFQSMEILPRQLQVCGEDNQFLALVPALPLHKEEVVSKAWTPKSFI